MITTATNQSGDLRHEQQVPAVAGKRRRSMAAVRPAGKAGSGRPSGNTDMPYACTRIRARLSRLLSPHELEQLHRCQSLAELLPRFPEADYVAEAQQAVLDASDLNAWEAMLMAVYVHRLAAACRLIQDVVPSYADLLVGEWDLHHLRCLVRRVFRGGMSDERQDQPSTPSDALESDHPLSLGAEETKQSFVRHTFVPLGAFSRSQYERLAESNTLDDLCDCLEKCVPDVGRQLRQCLDHRSPADRLEAYPTSGDASSLEELELLVENRHFRRQLACASSAISREDRSVARQCVALRIDAMNLCTSLRFLGRSLTREMITSLYVPGGSLNPEQFETLMGADVLEQLYHRLPRGPLTDALDRGMLAYANVNRVSVFQRLLEEQQLLLEKRLARRYPLSLAVPLYYAACLRNEWLNLKMIVRGIHFSLPAGKVRGNLLYV